MENNTLIVTTNNLNNSNKARREAEEKKELPEVKYERKSVAAKVKKESTAKKFKRAFFGENVENVGEYVIFDVMIPALKATLSDMVGNGIDVLLFGESRGRRSRNERSNRGTDYARVSRDRSDDRYNSRSNRRSVTYNDICFETKSDANECLEEVFDYVKEYDRISVAVYVSILRKYADERIDTEWRDDHYGWYKEDLARTEPIRTKYGWEIDLPRAVRID